MRNIIVQDKHGYSLVADIRYSMSERQDRIIAAGLMNYWWKKGLLDNLPESFEIVESEDRMKEIEIRDCGIAWNNGMGQCQCGHEECPRYQQSAEDDHA